MARKKSIAKSRKKSESRKIFLQVSLFVLTIIIIVLMLLIVEYDPIKKVSRFPEISETLALTKLSGRFFQAVNQNRKSGSEYCYIDLQQTELNAVFATLLRMYASEKKPHEPELYATWQNNAVNIAVSLKKCGVYWNLYLSVIPEVREGKLQLKVQKIHIGSLPLPAFAAEKFIEQTIEKQQNKDRRIKKFLQAVNRFQVKSNGAELVISRGNAAGLVLLFF